MPTTERRIDAISWDLQVELLLLLLQGWLTWQRRQQICARCGLCRSWTRIHSGGERQCTDYSVRIGE